MRPAGAARPRRKSGLRADLELFSANSLIGDGRDVTCAARVSAVAMRQMARPENVI